jgi:hypothetical protein
MGRRLTVKIPLEKWSGGSSDVFHPAGNYVARKAASLTDSPARLTARQAVFYRNLIRLAEELSSQDIPVRLIDAAGNDIAMDLGCVKMAEHAGFVQPLTDGPSGFLESVRLTWKVTA